jgi:para-aminobenzoate synthetase component 1
LFSGSIGIIKPNGDFDLNVVIRTMIYNQERKYLSCAVGSAITANSIPEKEYEECQLKVSRILEGINA